MTPFLLPNFPLMYLKRCTHDFNLQLFLTIQLLTYETMSKNIVLTDAMDCETWSLQKGVLYATFDLQDLIACKFSHRCTCLYVNICMSPNFLCSISTITFPHNGVVYKTYHIISYVLSRPPCFHAVC